MAYIGIQPAEKFTSFATQEFSTSATTSYTLDHAVANENELALFVNNVRQQPGSGKAYTASGTALTLSAATASTDTMYCVFLGRALQTVTPATNSITAAMVGNDLISGKDALTSSPDDTDEFLISDAGVLKRVDASLVGRGKVLQVVQDTKLDRSEISVSSAGTFVDISGLSVAITPSSTSSKILILAFVNGSQNVQTAGGFFTLKRDSTEIFRGDASSSRQRATGNLASYSNAYINGNTPVFLDSPSSTSELTYKVSVCSDGSNTTVYINRPASNNDNGGYIVGASSIIVMEIA